MSAAGYEAQAPTPRLAVPAIAVAVVVATAILTLYGFAAQRVFFVLAGIFAAPLGFAAMRWPEAATLAVVAILYTNAADVAVTFHGVPKVVGAAFPILLIIPLAKYLLIDREKLVLHPIAPLIAALFVVELFGALLARERGEALRFLTLFALEGVILYLLISNVVRTPQMLRSVTWVLVVCGALLGVLSMVQQATGAFDQNFGGFAQMDSLGFGVETQYGKFNQPRLGGPIGEQNRYAQIMLMLAPLGVFRVLGEPRLAHRLLAAAATFFIMVGVILTFSRGAALGLLMILTVMVFMRYIKLRHLGVILAGAVLLAAMFPPYLQRIASLEGLGALASNRVKVGAVQPDGALSGRATAMLCAAHAFLDHPLVGVGPGMFPRHYQDYARRVGRDYEERFREAHNLYLGIAAEYGLLGLVCFGLIFFITLRDLHRARGIWLRRRPELANMATAYMLAILSYMATGMGLHLAFFRFFWFMLAMAGAAAYIARMEQIRERRAAAEPGGEASDGDRPEDLRTPHNLSIRA